MKRLTIISISAVLMACGHVDEKKTTETTTEDLELTPVQLIEGAHSKEDFLDKEIVQFDIFLEFGGRERLNGTMTLATNSTAGKIAYKNGKELYFDQDKVYTDSATENTSRARFAAYTWSYFFLFPYKLSDPGTNWSEKTRMALNGENYDSQKLTFGEGVGDAPDDWYITYSDPETHLLKTAAYIVTAGGSSIKEAEEDPHAISYHDYKDVDGIALAHAWKFWEWRKDSGLARQLGKAELAGFQFLNKGEVDFSPPEGFMEID